ncbi:MAG: DUF1573 domain-containing protein [Planctomycetota bacterium]
MFRLLVICTLLTAIHAPVASAQQWARKMFLSCNEKLSHDFGVIAKGSKAVHDFEFQNIFEEDVHVAGVRSSCGCAKPEITKHTLKTWEKGTIRAVFNTKTRSHANSATLTVIIDRPYHAEVQLSVRGYIRADVLFEPGSAAFGEVEQGQGAERIINVSHTGRSNWEIVDVRSANPHFEVELSDRQTNSGRVTYEMLVRLKKDAPAGYIHDQLTIVTNDSYKAALELPVQGRVTSPLSVSPSSLFLGVLKPGEVANKQLFVRGSKPFKITSIDCTGDSFEFTVPDTSKPAHLVPVTFTAGAESGSISEEIEIKTDLGATTRCTASATITEAEGESSNSATGQLDDSS